MFAAFELDVPANTRAVIAKIENNFFIVIDLSFVLIFKASGVFNFAQGVFALFAALTLVGYQTGQVPFAHLINELFGTNYHN